MPDRGAWCRSCRQTLRLNHSVAGGIDGGIDLRSTKSCLSGLSNTSVAPTRVLAILNVGQLELVGTRWETNRSVQLLGGRNLSRIHDPVLSHGFTNAMARVCCCV